MSAKSPFVASNYFKSPALVVYYPAIVSKSYFLAVCKLDLVATASSKSPLSLSIKSSNPAIADYIWATLFSPAIMLFWAVLWAANASLWALV